MSPTVLRSGPYRFFFFSNEAGESAQVRWRAMRDSAIAAAPKPIVRCSYPELPGLYLIPKSLGEPLREITLRPGEFYSDTLHLEIWPSEFLRWPGYIDVAGQFLMGSGPGDAAGAVHLGKRDLRIAIPVP